MKNLQHTEAFPADWPLPASDQFILRYTTDPKYREQSQIMRGLFACADGTKYKFQTLPELAAWKYMATWFDNRNKSFGRAPGLPSDAFNVWPNIFLHIGPRPSPKHSIHRLDDTRNYEWGNVGWATRKVQAIERRDKRKVKFRGRNLTYEQLESELLLIGVDKSVNAIKSFVKRNRPKFKTEALLHAHMFASWGVVNAAHIHDPGILKTADFLPGYKSAVWWEREKEKAGPGMTRLEFQEKHFRRLIVETQHKQHGFKWWHPTYKELQHLLDDLNRHYDKFLKEREILKETDATDHIAKYSSTSTDAGYFTPTVAGFPQTHHG